MDRDRALALLSSGAEGVQTWNRDRPSAGGLPDLCGVDLAGKDLSRADLADLDLRGANLTAAKLVRASLRNCRLEEANMAGCDLREADLDLANLRGAALEGASLYELNLGCMDLREAKLARADMRHCYLSYANLEGAHMVASDLRGADLRGAKLTRAQFEASETDETTHVPGSWLEAAGPQVQAPALETPMPAADRVSVIVDGEVDWSQLESALTSLRLLAGLVEHDATWGTCEDAGSLAASLGSLAAPGREAHARAIAASARTRVALRLGDGRLEFAMPEALVRLVVRLLGRADPGVGEVADLWARIVEGRPAGGRSD